MVRALVEAGLGQHPSHFAKTPEAQRYIDENQISTCGSRFAVQRCGASASVRGELSYHHSPRRGSRRGRDFCCACQSSGARMEAAPSGRARMRRSGTQGTRPERRGPSTKGSLSQSSQSCRTSQAMRRRGQGCGCPHLTVFPTGRYFDAGLVTNVPYTCLGALIFRGDRIGRLFPRLLTAGFGRFCCKSR